MASQTEWTRLLEKFEARRKACVRRWWIALLVIGLVVAGCEYWLYVSEVEGAGVYAIPPFFAIFAVVISFVWITAGFKSDYKTSIIGPLLEAYGEGLTYEPHHGIDQSVYEASGLFHRQVDRYRAEDRISGTHRGARFQLCELHTEYRTLSSSGSGSNTSYHTIFKGIFGVIELSQPLALGGPVLVLPATLENRLETWGLRLEKSRYRRTELIETSDPEFEQKFYVYGEHPAEAQRVLPPGLRRKLLQYQERVENQLYLCFTDSTVYLAISSFRNYFEPRLFASLTDPETLRAYTDDLDLILEIIDSVAN